MSFLSIEVMRDELQELCLSQDIQGGVDEARSELIEARKNLDKADLSTRIRNRFLNDAKELQRIIELSESIAIASAANPLSSNLAAELLPIDNELLFLSMDRSNIEKKMNAPSCTEDKKRDFQEKLRQTMKTAVEKLSIKARILEKENLKRSSEHVDTLIQATKSRIQSIGEELSAIHTDVFPDGDTKKLVSEDASITPLEGVKLLTYAHLAKSVIIRSSDFLAEFRAAEQSHSSCRAKFQAIIDDTECAVFEELKHICKNVRDMNRDSFKKRLIKTKNYNENNCSWSVEHCKTILLWQHPQATSSPDSDCRTVSWDASLKISLNIFKVPRDKRICLDGRCEFEFDDKIPEKQFQVKTRGSKSLMIHRQPLYAWYTREIGAILTSIIGNPNYSSASCPWQRISNEDLAVSLNSRYLNCRQEPFCCNLNSGQAVDWDVDFKTMVASSREQTNYFPSIELKREEIGWFVCHFGDWTHLLDHEMKEAEKWYQCEREPALNIISEHGIGFEFVMETDGQGIQSMFFRYLNESLGQRKKMHRQILTSVQGQVIFACVKWPCKLVQKSEISAFRAPPSSEKTLQQLVESLVLVERKLARHDEKDCACSRSPRYSEIKSDNLKECLMACNSDIMKSLVAAVEYFMSLFYDRIRRTLGSENLSNYEKSYCVCPKCLSTQPVPDEETLLLERLFVAHVEVSAHDDENLADTIASPAATTTEAASAASPTSSAATTPTSPTDSCMFHPDICRWAREIRSCHRLFEPTWRNCAVSHWACSDAHRHIAKLFTKTPSFEKSLDDIDAAGMLNMLYYCTDDAFKDIDRFSCKNVTDVRNFVSHPSIKVGGELLCSKYYSSLCGIRKLLEELFTIVLSKASVEQINSFKTKLQSRLEVVQQQLTTAAGLPFRSLIPQPYGDSLFSASRDLNPAQLSAQISCFRVALFAHKEPPSLPEIATSPAQQLTPAQQEQLTRHLLESGKYREVCQYLNENLDRSCELFWLITALSASDARRPA